MHGKNIRERAIELIAIAHPKVSTIDLGIGQYEIDRDTHTAEVAFVVRDDCQNRGIGTEWLTYLTYLAKKQELLGFAAKVISDNKSKSLT